MKLEDEIMIAFEAQNRAVHPRNIRWRVLEDRIEREDYREVPKLKTFVNLIAKMDKVESIMVDGNKLKQLKDAWFKDRNMCYRCRVILSLSTVTGLKEQLYNKLTRVWSCLTTQFKILSIRLGTIKESISACYRRLK